MSRRCKDCSNFEYCGGGEYYCEYGDTSFVSPDDDADSCFGFDPVSGFEEREKRRNEKDEDDTWRNS